MPSLFERFRPQTWDELHCQPRVVATCKALARQGAAGRAVLFIGPTGCGKSSAANLLALEVASRFNVNELDACEATAARIRALEDGLHQFGLIEGANTKNGRVVILNEIHALKKDALTQLLVTLERIPSHVLWILTTTNTGAEMLIEDCIDATPLVHRCLTIKFAQRGVAEGGAEVVKANATAAGMDGRDVGWYVDAFKRNRNSWRGVYADVEAVALGGAVTD